MIPATKYAFQPSVTLKPLIQKLAKYNPKTLAKNLIKIAIFKLIFSVTPKLHYANIDTAIVIMLKLKYINKKRLVSGTLLLTVP